jgi:hypothetical protein
MQAGFFKAMSDNLTSVQPCTAITVCKPDVEFVVTPATATVDAVCAPVASVVMYFSPAIVLGAEDVNGTGLQDAIVAIIVNRTDLKYVSKHAYLLSHSWAEMQGDRCFERDFKYQQPPSC